MHRKKFTLFLLFILLRFYGQEFTSAQENKLFMPREIMQAIDKGTRTMAGNPGPAYFQNRADYILNAEFSPENGIVSGEGIIKYFNHSSTPLRYVVLRLYQNVFLKGGGRGRVVNPADVHDGVKIKKMNINGRDYDPSKPLYISQTNIVFPVWINPGDSAIIKVDWEFKMPQKTTNRFGCYDNGACFIAYWYPQVAVFDDIHGWDLSDYTGVAEFYNNYGDFEVNISVPKNYFIWATGELTNPQAVLNEKFLQRFNDAKVSDTIVRIINEEDVKGMAKRKKKGSHTWQFSAKNVNDFAFGTSSNYMWDATSVEIQDRDGHYKRVFIDAAYDIKSVNFRNVAEIAAWSVKDYSEDLPGIPFPYPKLTVFNGSGGMEFPMIVNDGETDPINTIFLTTHEVGHMYLPFMVGTDQKRHGWLDEGLITMIAQEQHLKKDSSHNFRNLYLKQYPNLSGTQADVPPLVNSRYISDDIFQIHDYMRPSLAFWTLRDILGQELFRECLIAFINIWEGKHPTPWDFFHIFEETSGVKLDWFFQPWFGEFSYPDLKINNIVENNSETHIQIANKGGMPFPSLLKINFSDSSHVIHPVSAFIWQETSEYTFTYNGEKKVVSARLFTEGYPDANSDNNYFERQITITEE